MPSTLQGTFYTYRPIRRLGQGAFGEVSLASVLETGDVVALKRIHIRNTTGIPDVVVREIKALQSVSHPNLVSLLDVFPKGQAIYLVQEYCTTDLAALLRRLPAPPPERIAKGLMLQLCRGLEALHAEGLMHRDVKPSNTLLSASAGAAKLADCGLARPLDGGERPAYTHAVATRWYRAPELLYGARAYGPAVDIWALGLVFAELLGLAPLIPGDNDIDQLGRVIATFGSMEPVWPGVRELPDWGKIAFPPAEPVPLTYLLPGASAPALDFLARFLRYDPAQRITAAEAVRSDYLTRQSPLPGDEAEISAWLLTTLEVAEAASAAQKAAAAAVTAAVKGPLAHSTFSHQQQQPIERQQQQLMPILRQRQFPPPLAVCWDSLPMA
ncbi:cyclin dependent kinase [Volvox carteri f. nagariensis]|uniref:cyclin-dependent kinase n=1 Tax=Volvox carteri f. nagariensis TaxID=3068 RepID=D8UE07_VOLCA|nr:cyclin dependent kinase [Volvox carteri f. nagariensis]EFJ42005.1 cyclin dependent kinase [Volvox carteri f. nagariensis]|eukprot:XP_002956880.1 cyclin dependent kinase [Volvox carteri f. nagariensis]